MVMMTKMAVCIVMSNPMIFKFTVMNVNLTFVKLVTGAMNFKQIMKLEFVIDAMPFIVDIVMKWINVMIAVKLFALHVRLF